MGMGSSLGAAEEIEFPDEGGPARRLVVRHLENRMRVAGLDQRERVIISKALQPGACRYQNWTAKGILGKGPGHRRKGKKKEATHRKGLWVRVRGGVVGRGPKCPGNSG